MSNLELMTLFLGILSTTLVLVVIFQNRVGVLRKELERSESRLSAHIYDLKQDTIRQNEDLKRDIDDLKKDMDTRMDRIERLIERLLFPRDDNGHIPVEKKAGKKTGTSV